MKANKKVQENVFYAATKSLCDENGQPLPWEFRHISTAQAEAIREDCMKDVPVLGKPGMYRPKLKTSEYLRQMITASVLPRLRICCWRWWTSQANIMLWRRLCRSSRGLIFPLRIRWKRQKTN